MNRLFVAIAMTLAAALPALAKDDCGGLKSAHCYCRGTVGTHMSSGGPDTLITPPGFEGQVLYTYTVPGKCFNQQVDAAEYRLGKGCWKVCRDGYGVDGATPDPGLRAAMAQAGKRLRAAGYCGGWVSAPSFFAAGTNKYRSNTAMGVGVGIGGSVVTKDGKRTCK